jgi:hypothetical protein
VPGRAGPRGRPGKLDAALKTLEDESYQVFRGKRRGFSSPVFGSIYQRWKAWKNGIPPTAGGYEAQNAHLMRAFLALDQAWNWAEHDNARR